MGNKDVNYQSNIYQRLGWFWDGLKQSSAAAREKWDNKTKKAPLSTDGTTGIGGEKRRKKIDEMTNY